MRVDPYSKLKQVYGTPIRIRSLPEALKGHRVRIYSKNLTPETAGNILSRLSPETEGITSGLSEIEINKLKHFLFSFGRQTFRSLIIELKGSSNDVSISIKGRAFYFDFNQMALIKPKGNLVLRFSKSNNKFWSGNDIAMDLP